MFVFDTTWTNVAYNKTASGSAQYASDANLYYMPMGCNGVIDMDIGAGDMINSAQAGAWWSVDLGAMYNVTRIMFFNRAGGFNTRSVGATVSYLNGFGSLVGQSVLNSNLVQTFDVALFPPSASTTPSATPTSSVTASATSQFGAGCPSSFGATPTHFLKTVSFTAVNDSTAYARHCAFWWFFVPGFPISALNNVDATSVWRLGLDGTPGSVSLQSVNYQADYMQVQVRSSWYC